MFQRSSCEGVFGDFRGAIRIPVTNLSSLSSVTYSTIKIDPFPFDDERPLANLKMNGADIFPQESQEKELDPREEE